MQEIESAHVSELTSSNLVEFVQQIEDVKKKFVPWPLLVAISSIAALWGLFGAQTQQAMIVSLSLFFVVLFCAIWWFELPKARVFAFYDFDEGKKPLYSKFVESFEALSRSRKVWNITSEAKVIDRKYHAGAGRSIKRTVVGPNFSSPPRVVSNIPIGSLAAGAERLFWFPDHLHVVTSSGHAAISYDDLVVRSSIIQFIEDGGVPSDSRVVDQTWRYVNKSGGPDRRFKDNRRLPVAEYGVIELSSKSGLREEFQVSSVKAADEFVQAIGALRKLADEEA